MKTKQILSILTAIAAVFSLAGCATVVKIGEEDALIGSQENTAMQVESFWETRAEPEIEETASDLAELLNAANGDLKSQSEQGRYTMGDSGDLNFAVHGTGTVTAVDTTKKAGTMTVAVEGYDGGTRTNA